MTTANAPVIPSVKGLESVVDSIRNNSTFRLVSVKPKASAEVAYVWRAVAKEVSPKEALKREITKVFTKDLSTKTIAKLDKDVKAIVKATKANARAERKLAKLNKAEPVVKEIEIVDVTLTCGKEGMGLCEEHGTCHHFFEINTPAKGSITSMGLCKHCGEVRQFFNSIHSQIMAKRKAIKEALEGFDVVDEDSPEMVELAMQDAMNAMAEL